MRPFVTAYAALSVFVSISVLFAPMCLAEADDHDVVEDHVRAKRELSEADETRFEALVKAGARASDEGRLNAAVNAYLKALRIRRDPLISGRVGRILATVDNAPTQVVAANNLYKAITEHAGVSLAERKGFFEAFDLVQSKICRISVTTKDVAVVQLDDNDPHKGYGSFWQFAEPGKHEIVGKLEGHDDVRMSVECPKGKRIDVFVEFEQKHTPVKTIESVRDSVVVVEVPAKTQETSEREVVAIEKALVPLEISLREEPAYLSVTTHEDALITIDGRLYGQAPIRKPIEMRSGPHTVRVSLTGHHSRQTSIQLEPGKTNSVALRLQQTRQRVTSYVLLGASGAAFLGVGVQSILALRQESIGQTILQKTDTGNITQAQLDDYNTSLVSRDGLRNSSLITLAGASVLGLAGAVAYLYDTQRTTDDTSTNRDKVAVSFTLAPSIAGINVTARF